MEIDKSATLNMVLRPVFGADETTSTVSTTPKDRSTFIGDLVTNIRRWGTPLAVITTLWAVVSALLIFVIVVGEPSKFGEASPLDFWDSLYYVTINLTGGFDNYHPDTLWPRLITVVNIVFGLAIFGMIVAIFTTAMSPDTEISVRPSPELAASVEITELKAIQAEQTNISMEMRALRGVIEEQANASRAQSEEITEALKWLFHVVREETDVRRRLCDIEMQLLRTRDLIDECLNYESKGRRDDVHEAIRRLACDLDGLQCLLKAWRLQGIR